MRTIQEKLYPVIIYVLLLCSSKETLTSSTRTIITLSLLLRRLPTCLPSTFWGCRSSSMYDPYPHLSVLSLHLTSLLHLLPEPCAASGQPPSFLLPGTTDPSEAELMGLSSSGNLGVEGTICQSRCTDSKSKVRIGILRVYLLFIPCLQRGFSLALSLCSLSSTFNFRCLSPHSCTYLPHPVAFLKIQNGSDLAPSHSKQSSRSVSVHPKIIHGPRSTRGLTLVFVPLLYWGIMDI